VKSLENEGEKWEGWRNKFFIGRRIELVGRKRGRGLQNSSRIGRRNRESWRERKGQESKQRMMTVRLTKIPTEKTFPESMGDLSDQKINEEKDRPYPNRNSQKGL
jgi:hypothetical protein